MLTQKQVDEILTDCEINPRPESIKIRHLCETIKELRIAMARISRDMRAAMER